MIDADNAPFWAITTFYNPQNYRHRYQGYKIFRRHLVRQKVNLLTVELAFGAAPFELDSDDAEILWSVRGNERHVMWQKEQLYNIALARLPPECTKFAWLDCDVIFKNDDWARQTALLLDEYMVVQPFETSVRLGPGMTDIDPTGITGAKFEIRPSVGYEAHHRRDDAMALGHTGFAWAARRSIFMTRGFYNKMIVGGGDTVLACAFLGRTGSRYTDLLPPLLEKDQLRWIVSTYKQVRGSISYTPGYLLHLWHGKPERRKTAERHGILRKYDFDPSADVRIADNGCLEWSTDKKIAKDVARYFWLRNEDGGVVREIALTASDFFSQKMTHANTLAIPILARWYRQSRNIFQRGFYFIHAASDKINFPKSSFDLGDNKLSIIILNWERTDLIKKIIRRYETYPSIDDIIIWNNNNRRLIDPGEFSSRVKIVNCRWDLGLDTRYAAALLANQENLLLHDDDIVVPRHGLELLFSRYLKMPQVIHSVDGRNAYQQYDHRLVYGEVDVVLTRCQIINKCYALQYFDHAGFFDYVRKYGCGNGEDIIMNFVVRKLSGRKNFAHHIAYYDYGWSKKVNAAAISLRPYHVNVRSEISAGCKFHLLGAAEKFTPDFALRRLLADAYRGETWLDILSTKSADQLIASHSSTVDQARLAQALSLLVRRHQTQKPVRRVEAPGLWAPYATTVK